MKHLLSLFAVVLFSLQATAQETIKDGMVAHLQKPVFSQISLRV